MPQRSPYRLYLDNIRKHRGYYSLGVLAMLLTSLSEVLLPKFIQWCLDVLTHPLAIDAAPSFFQRSSAHQTLDLLILSLVLILSLGWLGRVGWRQILARQTHLAGHDIKTRIWSVLKDQPLSLLDRYSLGDLMNRSTADWNKTRFIHGFTIVLTFDLIFFSSLSIACMLMIHTPLALLCLMIIPFLPKRIIRISKEEYKQHKFAQEQLSSLSDLISQSLKTIRLQRATAAEGIWIEKLNDQATEYARRQLQVLCTSWKIFIWGALPTLFAYVILLTLGIWQMKLGHLSLGGFIALQSYVLLLQTPLFELGSLISEWQTGFASFYRITEIFKLERPVAKTDPRTIREAYEPDQAYSLAEVSYCYESQHQAVKNINLILSRGDKIGLVGPIGSGKSTLLNILAGLIEEPKGDLKIFGIPLRYCGRDWIVQQVSMVPQKPFLFAGTVRHNLDPKAEKTDEELKSVLKSVALWNEVRNFPEGLDSWIGEAGINLSGGQKQRLALARALIKPSPILILDDALSAVDAVTEAKILENIRELLDSKTVIWAAHRISTLKLCKTIYSMKDGEMLEFQGKDSMHGSSWLHSYETSALGV